MRLNEVEYTEAKPVDGYAPEGFRVDGQILRGDLLCHPDGVEIWGGLEDASALLALNGKIDVLFLGMGTDPRPVPDDLHHALTAIGLGVEPMSTPSACRTYNVLLSEGRRVALAALRVG